MSKLRRIFNIIPDGKLFIRLFKFKSQKTIIAENYLASIKSQFRNQKLLGEKTFVQLEDAHFFWRYNEQSNSIAVIVKHLRGNMLSRWTDFLSSNGEKEWRKRQNEFVNDIKSRDEIMALWEEGWKLTFDTLENISAKDLTKIIFIRTKRYTVIGAINRQLAHYSYHVGQIVYIGKMLNEKNWISLYIPRDEY